MDLTPEELHAQSGYGQEITVTWHNNVAIIHMNRGENRFNQDFCQRFEKALDEVERNKDCIGVVTTGSGKFYNNGLDLDWFQVLSKRDPKLPEKFRWTHLANLLCRIVTFPVPMVAALNGHTFAMGAVLALAHDYRVMREDRGWFSLNEVHIGIALHINSQVENMARRRLPTKIFHDVVVLGKRYTGPEAKHESIVHATSSSQQLLTDAINVANRLKGIPRDNLRDMKQAIYADFLEICDKGLKNMSRL